MAAMADFPESHRALLDGQVATLATIEPDGGPQLTEIWFLFDEGELRLSLSTARRKTQNLQARPACALLLLDLENPLRYLEVRGKGRIEPDADGAFARKLGAKYGVDVVAFDPPGSERVVVTIEPTRIRPVDMSG
jgi:PPOX class probable F420-dependent enzyme